MNNDSSESIKTKKSSIKFPLRVKILSGIFLLLALAIGTILSYSTELILTDKKAYIYETGLQKTASIANTFKTDLDTYLQRIKDVSNKKDLSINDFFNYLGNNVFFFQKIDLLKGC